MTAVQLITEVVWWHEAQRESFVFSGVARGHVESYKASKLDRAVLTGCEGWRQRNLMKSHTCLLSEESLE